jgi:hypothetical protein
MHFDQIIFLQTGPAFNEQDEPSCSISDGIAYSTATIASACYPSSSANTAIYYHRGASFS